MKYHLFKVVKDVFKCETFHSFPFCDYSYVIFYDTVPEIRVLERILWHLKTLIHTHMAENCSFVFNGNIHGNPLCVCIILLLEEKLYFISPNQCESTVGLLVRHYPMTSYTSMVWIKFFTAILEEIIEIIKSRS